MIRTFHSVFGMYGFWLPNDPRGSGSCYVASWNLFRYGPATKVAAARSVARAAHDVELRRAAKSALRFPPLELSDREIALVAEGFAEACVQSEYRLHACAILPDHVHLVVGRHARDIRRIVGHF